LPLLCSRHHRLVHEGGFGVENVEGRQTFVTPTGQRMSVLPPVHEEQVAEDVIAALKAWARERDVEIGPDANLPWWDGAVPDYDLAISSLMAVG